MIVQSIQTQSKQINIQKKDRSINIYNERD